jgi:three-Cys-motif partner protein
MMAAIGRSAVRADTVRAGLHDAEAVTLAVPAHQPAEPERNLHPEPWPKRDGELVVGPDGLPARVVKAHNAHKKHYIERYTEVVAATMKNKWRHLAYIDTYCGPGLCWVKDTGEWVEGSPLIALRTEPSFTRFAFVDNDSVCIEALERRAAGIGANPSIRCADSNDPATIDWIRSVIPATYTLSLALLDPQGCTLEPAAIEALTLGRKMDLMINLPLHGLYRNLAAGNFEIVERVLGPDYPRCPPNEWRYAVREHYKDLLSRYGYDYSSSKEVRGEKTRTPIYDFVMASKHPLATKLFDGVTKHTAHGQMSMLG